LATCQPDIILATILLPDIDAICGLETIQ
jgi:hypothetical protein